ncbi:hypothetical protein BS50DRAFT_569010 [Corynespora cassiicola Philippines]|uniref:Uncharacterized protein n=1 Tax=Corynespora cassiicola Philippines TaxID=1448308 RepID=A0A2T2P719_CORCC|nr:hypothetical protein BS50DRAFT_569010 [Corynespora cassiicola Philippines]
MWNSHSERRTVENAQVEDLIRSDDILANALKRTRQVSGLHVSAVERQDDWPTSYDRLGIARQNYIVRMPARQGEIEDEPLNARHERDAAAYRAISHTYKTTASITEATEGRRERHVHGAIKPSSPVDSPPHSPIYDEDQGKGSEEGNPEAREGRSSRPIPEDVSPEHPRYQEYRTKFTDHYGVKRGQVGGFRVPYEPFNRRKLPPDERSKFPRINMKKLVDDQGLLKEPAPEGTSMQILEVVAGNIIDPPISEVLGRQTL